LATRAVKTAQTCQNSRDLCTSEGRSRRLRAAFRALQLLARIAARTARGSSRRLTPVRQAFVILRPDGWCWAVTSNLVPEADVTHTVVSALPAA